MQQNDFRTWQKLRIIARSHRRAVRKLLLKKKLALQAEIEASRKKAA